MQKTCPLSLFTAAQSSWLLILGVLAAGCAPQADYVPPPLPNVTVAKPLVVRLTDELEYTGNLQATDSVQIRARVNGYLDKIHFRDGDTVKEGELLFEIEKAPFVAALNSAKAGQLKAEANLALAEAEFKRTEPLVERGALAVQELDVKRANVATAKADVDSAKAAVQQATLNLEYTQVKSPIGGRISRHMVDMGNLVEAQTTILTMIEKYTPIHAYFNVSESDVAVLPQQMEGSPTPDEQPTTAEELKNDKRPPVFLGLPSEVGYPHEGRLDYTQLGIDPRTGTQQRRAYFLNANQQLIPGSFIRIRVPFGDESPKLLVPERAVGVDQRGEYVLIVNVKNVVEERRVVLGSNRSGLRVVLSGLQPDERVIINGLQRVRPTSEVTTEEATELPGVDPELVKTSRDQSSEAVLEPTPVSSTAKAGK
ncbi:Efflux pump periplasmic linker BepF [Anatilimnocola aggregata]|uniref:Efflux pump periplasmic linker BepF n=1 Tax=Anatilimnocola aggregata TaxID=2528021 RepID=A0A517YHQ5_9BACT|nr:efflux RND transporter periplasmic adaptor subunit [Anatilimnocola aggregata]QDU29770.1 Efflux pump periplasmic linker BepF [Anatilimnocola aggregata]